MVEHGASDLHLVADRQPMLRISGEIERIDFPPFSSDELRKVLYEITPDEKIKLFEETGDIDFAYDLPNTARFRINFFNQLTGIAAVCRIIPQRIMTMKQLGLPTIFKKFCALEQGLVLVTGPTGSGKSTTLAAMVDHINRNRKGHILTVEDPVEFVHIPRLCSVNHREVSVHTKSFSAALRGALREDPDVILVGEMRDLETIRLAIEAAATGHLVFGTLHTQSASKTIDRLIDVFPAGEQAKVRATLSEALKGIVAQSLVRKIEGGRTAALEILICNSAVSNLIREEKTFQIMAVMATHKKVGMKTMDDALLDLMRARIISPKAAFEKAHDKDVFAKSAGAKKPEEDIFS